jgi:hypothetical protein
MFHVPDDSICVFNVIPKLNVTGTDDWYRDLYTGPVQSDGFVIHSEKTYSMLA